MRRVKGTEDPSGVSKYLKGCFTHYFQRKEYDSRDRNSWELFLKFRMKKTFLTKLLKDELVFK